LWDIRRPKCSTPAASYMQKIITVWMLSALVRRIVWATELRRQKAGFPVSLFL
jgi:hypothetical protein